MSKPNRHYHTRTTSVIDEANEPPFSSSEEQDTDLCLDEDVLVDVENTVPPGKARPTSSTTCSNRCRAPLATNPVDEHDEHAHQDVCGSASFPLTFKVYGSYI